MFLEVFLRFFFVFLNHRTYSSSCLLASCLFYREILSSHSLQKTPAAVVSLLFSNGAEGHWTCRTSSPFKTMVRSLRGDPKTKLGRAVAGLSRNVFSLGAKKFRILGRYQTSGNIWEENALFLGMNNSFRKLEEISSTVFVVEIPGIWSFPDFVWLFPPLQLSKFPF